MESSEDSCLRQPVNPHESGEHAFAAKKVRIIWKYRILEVEQFPCRPALRPWAGEDVPFVTSDGGLVPGFVPIRRFERLFDMPFEIVEGHVFQFVQESFGALLEQSRFGGKLEHGFAVDEPVHEIVPEPVFIREPQY